MQKNNNLKIKKIIRLCRTWPTKKFNGIGLHAYDYSKFIDKPTKVFLKDFDKGDKPFLLSNVSIKKIKYKDLLLKKKNTNKFKLFFILFTKIIGEIIMFLTLIKYISGKETDYNILHIHSANYILSGFAISAIYKIPVVIQLGGTDIMRMEKSIIHRFVLKRIKYYICINNQISKKVKSINPSSKIQIVGNSADISLFKPLTKNKNLFVSIGNLRWQKDYLTLIGAFKIFCETNSQAKLLIFGEGPERKILESKIKELKMENNVFLKGYCNHSEIANTLSKSYLYIQSSVSEGLPKSILEGVSAGCPIISTNVGSCKEIADKFGISVEPNNSEDLAKAIIKLFLKTDLWEYYHKKCIKERVDFGWEKLVQKVSLFYDEIY